MEGVPVSPIQVSRRQALKIALASIAGVLLVPNTIINFQPQAGGPTHELFNIPSVPKLTSIEQLMDYILNHPQYFPTHTASIYDKLGYLEPDTLQKLQTLIQYCTPGSGLEQTILATLLTAHQHASDLEGHMSKQWRQVTTLINQHLHKHHTLASDQIIVYDPNEQGTYLLHQGLLDHINWSKHGLEAPKEIMHGKQYHHNPQHQPMYVDLQTGGYKLHYWSAKLLLNHHNISLASTALGTNEDGSSSASNRTCLEQINAATIDALILLIDHIRGADLGVGFVITGGTELGHNQGTTTFSRTHERGYKIDVSGKDVGALLMWLFVQDCHLIGNTRHYRLTLDNITYHYKISYHGGHFDIVVEGELSQHRKIKLLEELSNIIRINNNGHKLDKMQSYSLRPLVS